MRERRERGFCPISQTIKKRRNVASIAMKDPKRQRNDEKKALEVPVGGSAKRRGRDGKTRSSASFAPKTRRRWSNPRSTGAAEKRGLVREEGRKTVAGEGKKIGGDWIKKGTKLVVEVEGGVNRREPRKQGPAH